MEEWVNIVTDCKKDKLSTSSSWKLYENIVIRLLMCSCGNEWLKICQGQPQVSLKTSAGLSSFNLSATLTYSVITVYFSWSFKSLAGFLTCLCLRPTMHFKKKNPSDEEATLCFQKFILFLPVSRVHHLRAVGINHTQSSNAKLIFTDALCLLCCFSPSFFHSALGLPRKTFH